MRKKYDILIVGSGLGGLVSAALLSKEGMRVLVLEQNYQYGGNLQTFTREGCEFSTGMNYIGSLGEGQFLNRYFRYLGIFPDLKLRRMDLDGFEEISFGQDGKRYYYAQGKEHFQETLSKEFSAERKAIDNYLTRLWDITDRFPLLHLHKFKSITKGEEYLNGGAFDYIHSLTPNKRLQNVLSATNSLYAGHKEYTPLYVHALVNRQFIHSAWRFVDGSQQLVNALIRQIEQNGGELLNKSQVQKIHFENEHLVYVETHLKERYEARKLISNIHPSTTLSLIDDERLKRVYRKRIHSLSDTSGMFSVYFILKDKHLKYIPHNIYHFSGDEVWFNEQQKWPQQFLLYTPATSKNEEWATHATALSPMNYADVQQWENTFVENRGRNYQQFKQEKAEQLIDLIEKRMPGFRASVKSYYTSTPLSYRDYTGTRNGAAYGILKKHQNPYQTIILPRTNIPNLFFTGQNMNMHGALGVTAGAVLTSGEILGLDYLTSKIYREIQ